MAIASSRFVSRAVRSLSAIGACVLLSALSHAQLVYLTATINGAQETPPTGSPGTGTGCFTFDPSTNTLTFNISYSGLLGVDNAAHIHQGAPGVSGGIVIGLVPGSPITGTSALTAAQTAQLLAGNYYVNIPTTVFSGGEVRGQILVTPAPTLICLGDGSSGPCPCGNNSAVGADEGCLHSPGLVGGKLTFSGAPSLSCDTLQLCGSQLLGTNCLFIQGSTAPVGPFNFGDGLRCIGGNLKRMALAAVVGGNACLGGSGAVPIHTLGNVVPGTYGYAIWYRDNSAYCTPFQYNMTNAVLATWVP